MGIRKIREWVKDIIMPKSEEVLLNHLFITEAINVFISIIFILTVVGLLFSSELLWVLKFGTLTLISLIFLSTSTIVQYLIIIEFNTRKK